ncbi:MAG: helicase-related protein [Candidatus Tenebribacter davisii]|nr:helicase-related protein [Candidatus Tenebribacter davisii]
MSTDLTFFTNKQDDTLVNRFKKTLKHTKYFDVLVGYFRTSGFYQLYTELESVDKIRILVGLNVDRETVRLIDHSKIQHEFDFQAHKKAKQLAMNTTQEELNNSEDSYDVELGVHKFIEYLTIACADPQADKLHGGNGKKMEFRVYPSENIHAKVYINRYGEGQVIEGSVITGSSNFSQSGLLGNREFNVELKNKGDVEFALNQFNDLWKDGVDISLEYIDTVRKKTWLNDEISPYHLYLKMLYEYLKEDINIDQEVDFNLPAGFMDLQYQRQAVISAKKILEAYNGVFLADVVGLGKTFISAMLAQQLPGGKLIICPPVLKEYWEETLFEFGVTKTKVESIGKLEHILREGVDKYDTIFIDEAHRFRNEYTQGFEKLVEITYGKKVVLVSATPLNNTFLDIYNQIKLFQSPKKSTIPGLPNLEKFFKHLNTKLIKYKKSDPIYMELIKSGSADIREKVLKYIMVRRTRTEIRKHFSEDMVEQGLSFPDVADPRRFIYKFDPVISNVFNKTIEALKQFKYSRYMPLVYLNRQMTEFELQSQRNIGGFMKGILVKRLESSFYAFRRSLKRFIKSYIDFISMYDKGTVMISKKVNVYDILDSDDEEHIQKLIDEEKLQKYQSDEFTDNFIEHLHSDLEVLKEISALWEKVDSDPKLEKFIHDLKTDPDLKNKKIIVFTESKETAEYLTDILSKDFPEQVMMFSSHGGIIGTNKISHAEARYKIKENYDPNHSSQDDDINYLITTDVLAEGINLHRSNIIVNYDLPWNPTRVLQRVGRVNRVGTIHQKIFIYNFFPTDESDKQIGLEDNIKSKIQAFHDTLGEDAKYLTEDEIVSSHELFGDTLYKKLNTKKTYEGEDEEYRSELEYLKIIRKIRDNDQNLFEKIKRLPIKARSSKAFEDQTDQLLTFFRKGKLKKFIKTDGNSTIEIPFFDAVDHFQCESDSKRLHIPPDYYKFLNNNRQEFDFITTDELSEPSPGRGGRSNEKYVISRLKECRKHSSFTDMDEEYIKIVLDRYNEGIIPQNTTKRIKKRIEHEGNPLKMLVILKMEIPNKLLNAVRTSDSLRYAKKEVILSEYLVGEKSETK